MVRDWAGADRGRGDVQYAGVDGTVVDVLEGTRAEGQKRLETDEG